MTVENTIIITHAGAPAADKLMCIHCGVKRAVRSVFCTETCQQTCLNHCGGKK